MPEDSEYPFAFKYRFDVQTRGIKGGFSRVSGISEEIEVVDVRDGTDPFQIRKIKGTHQGGLVTMERGMTKNRQELWSWFADVKLGSGPNGSPFWSNVDVGLFSGEKQDFGLTISKAWPNRYEIGELDAKASEVELEVLSLAHEGIDWFQRTTQ